MKNKPSNQISIVLDLRREKVNGTFPVKLRVFNSITKKQKLYPTTFDFSENDFNLIWHEQKNKKKSSISKDDVIEIRKKLQSIFILADDTAKSMKQFNFEEFENKIFGRERGIEDNIFWQYEQTIKELRVKQTLSTASSYELTLKSIKNYLKHKSGKTPDILSFYDINKKWLEGYEHYMTSILGNSLTSVGIYLRTLRAIFNNAIASKIISHEVYPFSKGGYQIPTTIRTKKALDKELLSKLYSAIPDTKEQEKAKDFWFFSFSCNGMNVKDILLLKHNQFKGEYFEFRRAKTIRTSRKNITPIEVYLNDFSRYVINKYGTSPKSSQSYVFDILSEIDTPYEQHRKVQNFTKFINQHIKKLAFKVGITDDISTYWARHSFVTNSIRQGAKIEIISEAVGHNDTRITEAHYYGGADVSTKKELSENVMNF
ncbi:MAG: site-specific integrase [Bacteroidota bacterium]